MERLLEIARRHGIKIVEDAAQAYGSYCNGQPAGSYGDLSCFSFHGTKNLSAGEGGALVINDPDLIERAVIIREKGTNRAKFLAEHAAFYTWQDIGSSFVVNEMTSAFLSVQLHAAKDIIERQAASMRGLLKKLEEAPQSCDHNAHCFFVVLPNSDARSDLKQYLSARGATAVSHYAPLHSSPAGQRFGRHVGKLPNTKRATDHLLRLPLWHDLGSDQDIVIEAILDWCNRKVNQRADA